KQEKYKRDVEHKKIETEQFNKEVNKAKEELRETSIISIDDNKLPPKRFSILDRESPYNPKPERQTCTLLPKQIEAAKYIFDSIVLDKKHGLQLIGATGVGKTFVMGNVFLNLQDIGFF